MNTNENKSLENKSSQYDEYAEYKIGTTIYIVTGTYKKEGKEGLLDKLWRLIKSDGN
ncbi:MAG: transposon-encoded TnpW family protein [Oscillospiraceae bacterium]|nr:transposon-encoded TnpW family protein [Oscillospiraceae bacterium]